MLNLTPKSRSYVMIEVHVLGDSTMSGKESIIEDELYQENTGPHD